MTVLLQNVPLADYTTYKIGGPARFFAEVKNEEDIVVVLNEYKNCSSINKKIFILGGGGNTLFADEGYDGLVLKMSMTDIAMSGDNTICVGAGASLQDILSFATECNLTGVEWMAGIPGSFGGAIRGNAGAFGEEMKDCVTSVKSVAIQNCEKIIERQNNGEIFGYRTSVFKSVAQNEIIVSGEIKLAPGNAMDIQTKIQSHLNYRKEKQPLEWPSAGSTFKNVAVSKITQEQLQEWNSVIKTDLFPVVPVAFLISTAGLQGTNIGGAMISKKHSNFFINTGNAKASDVKALIDFTKKTIQEKLGIEIEEEIQIVSK